MNNPKQFRDPEDYVNAGLHPRTDRHTEIQRPNPTSKSKDPVKRQYSAARELEEVKFAAMTGAASPESYFYRTGDARVPRRWVPATRIEYRLS